MHAVDYTKLGAALAADLYARTIPGAIIAQFSCGRDARLFAALKNDSGEQVTITPGIDMLYAVRVLAEAKA